MKKTGLWVVAVALAALASCSKEAIKGNGRIETRTLTIPAFTAVESHYDIDAMVSQGTNQEASVTGYENLLDLLDFRVENGVLKLKFNSQYNTIRNSNIVATIKLPLLASATIHGSGNISVSGFRGGDLFVARIHGSGNINLADSRYEEADIHIYGSGNISGQGLVVRSADISVHGSGHTSVTVTEQLRAGIFGSGNIYYWGSPSVDLSINGSGRVIKR
jgi:hypothetical protein